MRRFKIAVIAAVAVLGVAALGGAAVRANASAGVKSTTPPASATVADPATTAEPDAGLPDTDNVQQGDQNGPDGAAATEATGEQAGSEVPGDDGPGGHADEPGNANADHQFQGVE
jgi:hypothetical protein